MGSLLFQRECGTGEGMFGVEESVCGGGRTRPGHLGWRVVHVASDSPRKMLLTVLLPVSSPCTGSVWRKGGAWRRRQQARWRMGSKFRWQSRREVAVSP